MHKTIKFPLIFFIIWLIGLYGYAISVVSSPAGESNSSILALSTNNTYWSPNPSFITSEGAWDSKVWKWREFFGCGSIQMADQNGYTYVEWPENSNVSMSMLTQPDLDWVYVAGVSVGNVWDDIKPSYQPIPLMVSAVDLLSLEIKIDVALVTNGEYLKFIEDGGYEDFHYWLADGWDLVQEQKWKALLYWEFKDGKWMKKDFRGYKEIDPDEPVVNVSYYEADAYARWAGKRLPTEAEWEKAASWNEDLGRKTVYPWGDEKPTAKHANLLESYIWSHSKVGSYPKGKSFYECHQMIGDVWEWTSSEYVLYPGFKPKFSEYTDKWAINQKVLRGGSFATSLDQIRNSYRNYFKPHERILCRIPLCKRPVELYYSTNRCSVLKTVRTIPYDG